MKRLLALFIGLTFGCAALAQDKIRVEKAADLPRFSYAVQGKVEDLARDDARFASFAAALRRDTESVLARYAIADKSAERGLLATLLLLDLLENKDADALAQIDRIRALEEKPADKLLSGLQARAIVEARRAAGNMSSDAYVAAVRQHLAEALKPLPFDVVGNGVKEAKAGAELMGEGRALGYLNDVLQPTVDKTGALSSDLAPAVVGVRYLLKIRLPLKAALVQTYSAYLDAHKVEKADIWAARQVSLPPGKGFAPVNVAVWDSGVDTNLFAKQLARDASGRPLVIGFDKYSNPQNTELVPLTEQQKARMPLQQSRTKGFSDLQSDIDSPEANEVKQWLSSLRPDQYKPAIEELRFFGNYEHGTHVAGIALAGNPYARLVIGRIEFGSTLLPDPCPSRAQAEKDARAAAETVDFFKRNDVRVVNMSWGGSVKGIEEDLEQCGIGKTPEERKKIARELFEIDRKALEQAFRNAPGIVFVTAAGNSNQNASFAEDVPADLVLPNLLTVGAVDQAGDEASFTSYGPTVKVDANGYQVESFIPGGKRVALSGTSMASPQVANLAAKILAVNPSLTPPQVIDLIVSTAERTADGRRVLINPKKAMAAAQMKKAA